MTLRLPKTRYVILALISHLWTSRLRLPRLSQVLGPLVFSNNILPDHFIFAPAFNLRTSSRNVRFVETVVVPRASPARRAILLARRSSLWPPVHHSAITPLHRFESHLFRVLLIRRLHTFLSHCPPASASVAFHSTALATTTAQVARGQGPWEAWLRIGVCSGAFAARQVPECPPMCSCGTSTSPSAQWISSALRSSLRGSLSFTGLRWQSTPAWCRHSADGEPHRRGPDEDGAALTITRRRKERTYPELTGGSGRAKLVVIAGGRPSSDSSREPGVGPLRILVAPVGLHPLLCRCPGLRMLVAWSAWQVGRRRGRVFCVGRAQRLLQGPHR